jgi:hypothetical protein
MMQEGFSDSRKAKAKASRSSGGRLWRSLATVAIPTATSRRLYRGSGRWVVEITEILLRHPK